MDNLDKIIKVMQIAEKLKQTPRAVYTSDGNTESTAAHCWGLSFLFIMLNRELNLDVDAMHYMELITAHDIAEAITGDYAAYKVGDNQDIIDEKESREEVAMQKIKSELPDEIGQYIYDLWKEYENGETKEAKLIKALDKQECVLQILNAKDVDADWKHHDARSFLGIYGNKQIKKTPELNEFGQKIKKALKEWYNEIGKEWKDDFDI